MKRLLVLLLAASALSLAVTLAVSPNPPTVNAPATLNATVPATAQAAH